MIIDVFIVVYYIKQIALTSSSFLLGNTAVSIIVKLEVCMSLPLHAMISESPLSYNVIQL